MIATMKKNPHAANSSNTIATPPSPYRVFPLFQKLINVLSVEADYQVPMNVQVWYHFRRCQPGRQTLSGKFCQSCLIRLYILINIGYASKIQIFLRAFTILTPGGGIDNRFRQAAGEQEDYYRYSRGPQRKSTRQGDHLDDYCTSRCELFSLLLHHSRMTCKLPGADFW